MEYFDVSTMAGEAVNIFGRKMLLSAVALVFLGILLAKEVGC